MLFALWDYSNYRRRVSRYSDAELERKCGIRAARANFPDRSHLIPGAIILFHTRNSFLAWVVMYYTDSVWSHCAIIVNGGDVVHATTSGVFKQSFYDFCDGESYISIRYPRDRAVGIRAASHAETMVGAPYAWGETISTFVLIILGIYRGYRISFFLDFTILILPVAAIGWWKPSVFWRTAAVLVLYGTVVLLNIALRRAFGRSRVEEQLDTQ
jgi:hypothetical protein